MYGTTYIATKMKTAAPGRGSKMSPSCRMAMLFVSLLIALLMPGNAHAALPCNACHTMPPTDSISGSRDPDSGALKGNHAAHSSASVNSCIPCHGAGVASYAASHSSAARATQKRPVINIAPKIRNYSTVSGRAAYSRGTFFNQTSIPPTPLGSCANVSCHFEATTPPWGSPNFTSPGDCNRCHGAAPPDGSHPYGAGKHAAYFGTTTTSCVKCHPDHTAEPKPFAHATSAGNRGLVISFAAAPNNGFGRYSGNVSFLNALPSQGSARNGTCKGLYCHSDGQAAPVTYAAPRWGDPGTAQCGSCHGANAAVPPASVRHGRHVGSDAPYRYACSQCHNKTVKPTANSTGFAVISSYSLHVNRNREVYFDSVSRFGNYSSANLSCNSVYCHSTGNTGVDPVNLPGVYGGNIYTRPKWTDAGSLACNACHGRSTANGMPDYANAGAPGSATANSHPKHVTGNNISCNECHEKTTKNNASIRNLSPGVHVNGSRNVFFNLSGANRDGIFNSGTATCSNVACHSNGRGGYQDVQWGAVSNCGLCHPMAGLSATHAKHIDTTVLPTIYGNMTANRSTTAVYNFGCASCHPLVNSSHTSGTVVLDFRPAVAGIGTLRSRNSALITTAGVAGTPNGGTIGTPGSSVRCLNVYCHSNGYAANPVYAVTPNWYGGAFTGDRCANCHGNSPNSVIAGSAAHYNTRFLGFSGATGGHAVGIHAMSIYSSPGGLAHAGTGGASSHGNAATATTISCNLCHYATITGGRNDDNMVCRTCHFPGNTVGALAGNPAAITDKSSHVNGMINVEFRNVTVLSKAQMRKDSMTQPVYSSAWSRKGGYKVSGAHDAAKNALDTASMWNGATKTCSNIACHNGQGVSWGDTNGTTTCLSCHPAL